MPKSLLPLAFVLFLSLSGFAQTGSTQVSAAAVVRGKELFAEETIQLRGRILGELIRGYAEDHNIKPTAQELDAFVANMEEQEKEHLVTFTREEEDLRAKLASSSLSTDEYTMVDEKE